MDRMALGSNNSLESCLLRVVSTKLEKYFLGICSIEELVLQRWWYFSHAGSSCYSLISNGGSTDCSECWFAQGDDLSSRASVSPLTLQVLLGVCSGVGRARKRLLWFRHSLPTLTCPSNELMNLKCPAMHGKAHWQCSKTLLAFPMSWC